MRELAEKGGKRGEEAVEIPSGKSPYSRILQLSEQVLPGRLR